MKKWLKSEVQCSRENGQKLRLEKKIKKKRTKRDVKHKRANKSNPNIH